MKTILLVDDEPLMLDLLALYLSPAGYDCLKMTSAIEAIDYLESHHADLILLDVMMPDMNGWDACRKIREHWDIPIIMLTALGEKPDIVKGLKIGADDYISKPFDEEELLARIEAVIRRNQSDHDKITFLGLELDLNSFVLQYSGKLIPLTPKEFAMMEMFLKNRNKVFSREHLITSIWGYGVSTEDRTIDSHVRNLRDKLRKAGFPADEHLVTVWGVGYKWGDKN
jgi:DNA-binding response OmpR family regulator